jgi:precorrin-6A/cobalt-precorrin-6A reductase
LPAGETRIGGFGGAEGLTAYLRTERPLAVIDATHPFAATMGTHAALACSACDIPLLRFQRPAWVPGPADQWHAVGDWDQAVSVLAELGARRVLLALGRQDLAPFTVLREPYFLVRCVTPPDPEPDFAHWELLLDRGPFDLDSERALLDGRCIDCIVCKNSGGTAGAAKLRAARELGIEVLMRERPARPPTATAPDLVGALTWLDELMTGQHSGAAEAK